MTIVWSKIPIISANGLGQLPFGRGALEGKVSPVEGKGDKKERSETEKANCAGRGKTREQEADMSQL